MLKIVLITTLISFVTSNLAIQPRILNIQRISLNSFRINWKVNNLTDLSLTRYRIYAKFEDTIEFREWPAQLIRVNMDGVDAETLQEFQTDSLEFCAKKCTENRECRFVVKHFQKCYLKDAVPNGSCNKNDGCLSVKKYYNEAEITDLPLYTAVQVKVQVFDSYSQVWSELSEASRLLCTNIPKNYFPLYSY